MHEPRSVRLLRLFGNYQLESTRKDTTYHHWQQPLVTHSQEQKVLKCEVNYSYTVRTNSVSVLCESQLPRFRNLPVNEPSKKPPCRVVFVYKQRLRLSAKDLKKILWVANSTFLYLKKLMEQQFLLLRP